MTLLVHDKLDKALKDITPYIGEKLSEHMGVRMDVIVIGVTPTGDIRAFGTMPEGFQHQVHTALVQQLEVLRDIKRMVT